MRWAPPHQQCQAESSVRGRESGGESRFPHCLAGAGASRPGASVLSPPAWSSPSTRIALCDFHRNTALLHTAQSRLRPSFLADRTRDTECTRFAFCWSAVLPHGSQHWNLAAGNTSAISAGTHPIQMVAWSPVGRVRRATAGQLTHDRYVRRPASVSAGVGRRSLKTVLWSSGIMYNRSTWFLASIPSAPLSLALTCSFFCAPIQSTSRDRVPHAR